MIRIYFLLAVCIGCLSCQSVDAQNAAFKEQLLLEYKAAPPDNPLKGLVPYAGQGDPFPHSLEFWYFPMNRLMVGPNEFDWSLIENKLDEITGRRCQAVIRVFMEYPGRKSACPDFLVEQGVEVLEYEFDGNDNFTPAYNDPRTVAAMIRFIEAFGKKYDGDVRVGFITMGILGHWGEWHTYPKGELFASKEVQSKVMDAFETAFTKTKILMRYPAGPDTWGKAPNHQRPFGYHDDSFAWATLPTGREEDDWFFMPAMDAAGKQALNKWRTQPIGGEIRPEIWGCVFDHPSCGPKGQEFEECVKATHASWLMDSGMFETSRQKDITPSRLAEAISQVQKMGYEFFVRSASVQSDRTSLKLSVEVINRGVAPFYYDWPVSLILKTKDDKVWLQQELDWKLTGLQPNEVRVWKTDVELPSGLTEKPQVLLQVLNPMPTGMPLRFANQTQGEDGLLLAK
jgi:hypothetical protein